MPSYWFLFLKFLQNGYLQISIRKTMFSGHFYSLSMHVSLHIPTVTQCIFIKAGEKKSFSRVPCIMSMLNMCPTLEFEKSVPIQEADTQDKRTCEHTI